MAAHLPIDYFLVLGAGGDVLPGLVDAFPLPVPEGFPVVLGAFFKPLDFPIFLSF